MDGLREDDEVIDAEYWEVEPEEAESEIDDYAIPDEPESYASNRTVKAANSHEDAHEESNEAYVSAYGMTPQEAADEDRMVTQAEYGAEIEAETTEKDPSELQYITPIDYAKRIAELDEDLRDAAEIAAATHHLGHSLWMWWSLILHLCQINLTLLGILH